MNCVLFDKCANNSCVCTCMLTIVQKLEGGLHAFGIALQCIHVCMRAYICAGAQE